MTPLSGNCMNLYVGKPTRDSKFRLNKGKSKQYGAIRNQIKTTRWERTLN